MQDSDWITPVEEMIRACHRTGAFIVVLPEYRPDQIVALARQLGLPLFDYRGEIMSTLGWDADRLTLQDLDAKLTELVAKSGAVVNNTEALLSTKSEQERSAWIDRLLQTNWDHALVIPIVINAAHVPMVHPRVHRVPVGAMMEQSFINRLAY